MNAKGIPVVAANIIVGDAPAVKVEIGSTVTVTAMEGASEKEYTGEVLAIELNNKPFYGKRDMSIYDGIPTSEYKNPVNALIDNAADCMIVSALLVEAESKHVRIPVHMIKSISAG